MRIIPAIDLIGGKCVRLSKGDFDTKQVYNEDPLSQACEFEAAGIRYLHLVDLDGAKTGAPAHLQTLHTISQNTGLTIDFGGGVKSEKDIEDILRAGASQISVGSLSVKRPADFSTFLKKFGAERFILAADVLNEQVMIDGWKTDSGYTVYELIDKYIPDSLQYVMVTDISKDGMLEGASHELYGRLTARYPSLRFIASGGVTSFDELPRLRDAGMDGAIVGKAYYEGHISLEELACFR